MLPGCIDSGFASCRHNVENAAPTKVDHALPGTVYLDTPGITELAIIPETKV